MKIETYPLEKPSDIVEKIIHIRVCGTQSEIDDLRDSIEETVSASDDDLPLWDILDLMKQQLT